MGFDLIPVQRIPVPDWAQTAPVRAVLAALQQQYTGDGPAALFVGGCVRNAVLGEAVGDIDMATPLVPADMIRAAKAAGIKVALTGIEHGTLTLIADHVPFQVTTLREDVETDGRHARVAFSCDWVADAQRRDFTMNTLLMDGTGAVYDPLGSGLADLRAGQVRFVGDAAARIREDHLRILRFFRFYGRYGRVQAPDPVLDQTLKTITEFRSIFTETDSVSVSVTESRSILSAERVTEELKKIIILPNVGHIITLMRGAGVLSDRLSEVDIDKLSRYAALERDRGQVTVIPRFLWLVGLDAERFAALARRMRLSRAETLVGTLVLAALSELEDTSEKQLKSLIYNYDFNIVTAAVLARAAQKNTHDVGALDALRDWPVPVFPLSGNDLMEMGVPAGPKLGEILKALEKEWIESNFSLNINALKEKAKVFL